ncbi:MAG TPA: response regulator transcription factor [Chloroflexota bacterium]|nr:response regulator transcription factor [Chloroflexota bacterium]
MLVAPASGQRVLVVDDDPQIRRALRVGLTSQGYKVHLASTASEALDAAASAQPDLIILDLMLPDQSGLEVCRELRQWSAAPIIVLSARDQERDKVQALDLGADDYLTKPFGLDELLARMRAVLRRGRTDACAPVLVCGELRLDQARRLVTLGGQEIHLTPTEYELLRYLMANAGKIVTHRELLHAVWGAGAEGNHAMLHVFIAQLRRKIDRDPTQPSYIRTEPRVGYRFRAAPGTPLG